jgi:hypothetical protein
MTDEAEKAGKREVMRLRDLPPEEREEVIRMMKESLPDVELTDDTEFDYFLFPFPKDGEAIDETKPERSSPQPRSEEGK